MTDMDPQETVADAAPVIPVSIPDDPVLAGLVGGFPSVYIEERSTGDVAHVPAEHYAGFITAARDAGYGFFVDLCGVDYLRRRPRFEVVVNLLSHTRQRRLRIRTGVEGLEPSLPTISDTFAGANFYERETYDLFGIAFAGHPDLTRILLPDEWEGHPLRKDYSVGSVPVQFKGAHKAS